MEISPESAYKWPFQSPTEWTTGRTLTLPALVMPKGPKKEEAEAMIVQCRTNILNIRKDKTNISAHRCRWSTVYHPIGAIHCKNMISDIGLIVSIDKAANQSEKRNKSRECQVALKKLENWVRKAFPVVQVESFRELPALVRRVARSSQHPRALMDTSYGPWQGQLWQLPSPQNRFFLRPNFQKKHQDTQCSGRVAKLEVPPPKCVLQSWHSRHFQWTQCCISGLTNTTSHLSFGRNANVSANQSFINPKSWKHIKHI